MRGIVRPARDGAESAHGTAGCVFAQTTCALAQAPACVAARYAGTGKDMEEHRFACPTHVREFTRFRGHSNASLEIPEEPAPDEQRSAAPAAEDARGPATAGPPPAR
jgi:hypothetical protein